MKRLLEFVLVVAVLGGWAQAQFIGYVSPQTVQQTLATNLACTGANQFFPISNLGQTQHYLQIGSVAGATTFKAQLQGLDNQGNPYPVSDVLLFPSGAPGVTLRGSGYWPQIRALIQCLPGTATFTMSYSGAWGTTDVNAGSYLVAQVEKPVFTGAAENTNQSSTTQTPFGSSSAQITFTYSVAGAGGSLTFTCGNTLQTVTIATYSLASVTTPQTFYSPDLACIYLGVNYTNNGVVGTIQVDVLFTEPGHPGGVDPCQAGTAVKSSQPFLAAAAGTTQIIPLTTGMGVYVCGFVMSQIATAGTVQWQYGTGASCGTGNNPLTGAIGVTASQPFSYSGPGTVFKAPTSNAVCLATTGAGGTASGVITYVLAP